MKKRVITYGTFDLLHKGHINILKKAKNLGDELYVGLSTDSFNNKKGKRARQSFETRKQRLEELDFIEKVFPENSWKQKRKDILSNDIDILTMGSDWQGKFDDLSNYCEIIITERTKGISSTALRMINLEVNIISDNILENKKIDSMTKWVNDRDSYIEFNSWNLKELTEGNLQKMLSSYKEHDHHNNYDYTAFVILDENFNTNLEEIINLFELAITNREELNIDKDFLLNKIVDKRWVLLDSK